MAIETAEREEKAAQILIELGADESTARMMIQAFKSPDADRIERFLQMDVNGNDEKGFLRYCPGCNDFTGHWTLQGSDWYFERCLRCRAIRAWEVVSPRWPRIGKAVLMPPGMDARGALKMTFDAIGPDFFARCFEVWFQRKVKERMRDILRESKALTEKL